ncbi:MAG: DUF1616 domain-containing protein [Candidatus Bathyarchaeia archaeon]
MAAAIMPSIISSESPLIFLNYILGFVYISFIPGHCFLRLLFLDRYKEIDFIEMIVLSVILSFSIAGLSGLILGLTPIGLNQTSVRISLSLLTILFAVIAITRSS